VAGPRIGVFALFRLPLGAFTPHDVMYVYDRGGNVAGLLRAERESSRDEWTVVELDAVGDLDAGDVRYRLVQHLLRDGAKRGALRFHVACADADDNVELFMQAGFVRYGDERLLFRDPRTPLPAPMGDDEAASRGIRESRPQDALALSRLYASVTPSPVQRLEALRLPDWERQGRDWRVPRSSLAPILRFADVETFVLPAQDGGSDGTQLDAFIQVGVAKEDQPHYLKVLARPEAEIDPLLRYGLGVIAARTDPASASRQGVLAPVRTYESPVDRRLEEEGFERIAVVTLLMKETLVRVAEPRLVPAGVR
jgi:hypothetical protein